MAVETSGWADRIVSKIPNLAIVIFLSLAILIIAYVVIVTSVVAISGRSVNIANVVLIGEQRVCPTSEQSYRAIQDGLREVSQLMNQKTDRLLDMRADAEKRLAEVHAHNQPGTIDLNMQISRYTTEIEDWKKEIHGTFLRIRDEISNNLKGCA